MEEEKGKVSELFYKLSELFQKFGEEAEEREKEQKILQKLEPLRREAASKFRLIKSALKTDGLLSLGRKTAPKDFECKRIVTPNGMMTLGWGGIFWDDEGGGPIVFLRLHFHPEENSLLIEYDTLKRRWRTVATDALAKLITEPLAFTSPEAQRLATSLNISKRKLVNQKKARRVIKELVAAFKTEYARPT